jgi:hypothetical protein
MNAFQKPPPLAISCTSVDCDNDLHCFKKLQKMRQDQLGHCRVCDADLIDWDRIHKRDLKDVSHTFKMLKHELIRHHFFHVVIDGHAVRHAQRKGRLLLKEATRDRLRKYLAPTEPPRDGRQTPMHGSSIFYGQHATATCCRTCLEYWHDIPKHRELTESEVEYCGKLIDLFLEQRLPALSPRPIKVPANRAVVTTKRSIPRQ